MSAELQTTTQSTTHTNKRERQSCGAPHGTYDQSLLWKDVRQGLLFVAAFTAFGGGAVLFLTAPRHVQAMVVYSLIVTGCALLAMAGLRRRAK